MRDVTDLGINILMSIDGANARRSLPSRESIVMLHVTDS